MLLQLEHQTGLAKLIVSEGDELDFKSVRIMDNQLHGLGAYVYTYGQTKDYYGVQLEYPAPDTTIPVVSDAFENLSVTRLIEVLTGHFNLV